MEAEIPSKAMRTELLQQKYEVFPVMRLSTVLLGLLIAVNPVLFAEVEVSNSTTADVLSHYITCRRPSDISRSPIPEFIKVELGQTVRHLPINQIAQIDEQSYGVCLEWPTSRMKNGGGFMAITICVPPEVMPPDAVFGILGAKNRFSDGRTILPEFEVGTETFRLPFPDDLYRLDGRFLELDLAVKKMAQGAGNRVIALFGHANDDEALREKKFPSLERTVSVQTVTKMEDADVPPGGFSQLKEEVRKAQGKPDKKVLELLQRIESSTETALSQLTKLQSAMEFDEVAMLGEFSSDDTSICHSVLANTKGIVGDQKIQKTQATSVCVMQMGSKIISLYVSAVYESLSDLEWTRRTCISFRDQLRQVNRDANKAVQ